MLLDIDEIWSTSPFKCNQARGGRCGVGAGGTSRETTFETLEIQYLFSFHNYTDIILQPGGSINHTEFVVHGGKQ